MEKFEKNALLDFLRKKEQKNWAAMGKAELETQFIFYKAKRDAYEEMITCVESNHYMRVQNFKNRTAWRGK